jgi:hypothetical protein
VWRAGCRGDSPPTSAGFLTAALAIGGASVRVLVITSDTRTIPPKSGPNHEGSLVCNVKSVKDKRPLRVRIGKGPHRPDNPHAKTTGSNVETG